MVIEVGHNLGQLIEWALVLAGWAVVIWLLAVLLESYSGFFDD